MNIFSFIVTARDCTEIKHHLEFIDVKDNSPGAINTGPPDVYDWLVLVWILAT